MDFKKDLAILAYICPTGSGRMVTLRDPILDGKELKLFLSGGVGITTDIFNGKDILDHLNLLTKKFMDLQEKSNKELAKKGEKPKEILSESYYEVLIDQALAGPTYKIEQFDRYESDTICPENETQGLYIDFIKKMSSMFSHGIKYSFADKYIVGSSMANDQILFVVSACPMHRQLQLLSSTK